MYAHPWLERWTESVVGTADLLQVIQSAATHPLFLFLSFLFVPWRLNPGPHACQARTRPIVKHCKAAKKCLLTISGIREVSTCSRDQEKRISFSYNMVGTKWEVLPTKTFECFPVDRCFYGCRLVMTTHVVFMNSNLRLQFWVDLKRICVCGIIACHWEVLINSQLV